MNNLLPELSGIDLICPFYHTVSDNFLAHLNPLYTAFTPEEFISQLDYLGKFYDFIDAEELLKNFEIKREKGKRPKAYLSFDDGLKECSEIIAPILIDKGIPATFFVNPAFIDSEDIFYRYKAALLIDRIQNDLIDQTVADELKFLLGTKDKLRYTLEDSMLHLEYSDTSLLNEALKISGISFKNENIYMSVPEIKQLARKGFHIGGHSMDHPEFSRLSEEEQLRQVKESVDYCRDNFDQKLRLFAFPFYDYNLPAETLKRIIHESKIDLSFGTSGPKKDSIAHSIQRIDMENIAGEFPNYLGKMYFKHIIKRSLNRHFLKRS